MKAVYLLLIVGTWTPDNQYTRREIFVPMASTEACAATMNKTLLMRTVGRNEDTLACVYYKHDRRDE